MLSIHCNRNSFATRHTVERLPCKDGETSVVWWPLVDAPESDEPPQGHDIGQLENKDHLWVILPGGMTNAAAGYVDDTVGSGAFIGSDWCDILRERLH